MLAIFLNESRYTYWHFCNRCQEKSLFMTFPFQIPKFSRWVATLETLSCSTNVSIITQSQSALTKLMRQLVAEHRYWRTQAARQATSKWWTCTESPTTLQMQTTYQILLPLQNQNCNSELNHFCSIRERITLIKSHATHLLATRLENVIT